MQAIIFLGTLAVCYGFGITSPLPMIVAIVLCSILDVLTRMPGAPEPAGVRVLQFFGLFFFVSLFTQWIPAPAACLGLIGCSIFCNLLSPHGSSRSFFMR